MLAKVGVEMEVQLLGKSGHWGLYSKYAYPENNCCHFRCMQMANATWHMGIFFKGAFTVLDQKSVLPKFIDTLNCEVL